MEWAVSRILYPAKRVMTIYLGCRSPGTSSDLPGSIGRAALKCLSIWSCFGWGLPCLSCRHESGELLPRLFTLTPSYGAVCFLWHFPPVTRRSSYEPPCPVKFGLSSGRRDQRSCAHSTYNSKNLAAWCKEL